MLNNNKYTQSTRRPIARKTLHIYIGKPTPDMKNAILKQDIYWGRNTENTTPVAYLGPNTHGNHNFNDLPENEKYQDAVILCHGNNAGDDTLGFLNNNQHTNNTVSLKHILRILTRKHITIHTLMLNACYGHILAENFAFQNGDPHNSFQELRALEVNEVYSSNQILYYSEKYKHGFATYISNSHISVLEENIIQQNHLEYNKLSALVEGCTLEYSKEDEDNGVLTTHREYKNPNRFILRDGAWTFEKKVTIEKKSLPAKYKCLFFSSDQYTTEPEVHYTSPNNRIEE